MPATALYIANRIEVDDRVKEIMRIATGRGVPIMEVMRPELDRLTGADSVHQGLALKVPPYQYSHPSDLLDRAARAGEAPLIVALDGVTDPRNLGAIVRSAAAFGAHGVVIPQRRSAGMTASAWKTSAGAAARLPVALASNLNNALKDLKADGLFIAGLDAGGDVDLPSLNLAEGAAGHRRRQRGRGPLAARTRDLRRHRLDSDRGRHRVAERRHRGLRVALRDLEAASGARVAWAP